MEAMSGFSLADVVVHRHSAEPARLGAAAFTKGNQIHLAPGGERHLAHEAWHVVQQARGPVRPTLQMAGAAPINDDAGLEREADIMGAKALANAGAAGAAVSARRRTASPAVVQMNGKGDKGSKVDDTSKLFRTFLSSASADQASQNVGGIGGAVPFIVRTPGAEPSSAHHIFPKNKLKATAAALSKYQAAAHAAKTAVDAEKDKNVRTIPRETANQLSAFATMVTSRSSKLGISANGSWAVPTPGYYWLNGNLLVGVNSGYRTDDPKSEEETVCPQSFPADRFQAAKAWGKYTVAMEQTLLSKHGSSFSYDASHSAVEELLDTFLKMLAPLKNAPLHVTREAIGEDWTLGPTVSAAQYVSHWGSPGHQYMLNKSAGNKFAALATHGQETAKSITASVRKAMPIEQFNAIRTPLLGQLAISGDLRKYYFIAADTAETDPKAAFSGLKKLAPLMQEAHDNPVYWNLIPVNDQPNAQTAIQSINTLRQEIAVRFGTVVA